MSTPHAGWVSGADGWRVRVDVATPPDGGTGVAALTVPATKHERDGWGVMLRGELLQRGFTVMHSDVRGRGDSTEPHALHAFLPGMLACVPGDVAAALDALASRGGSERGIVLFGEQDTADAVADVAAQDRRVRALVLVSGHLHTSTVDALAARNLPVCALASKEDRHGTSGVVAAYAASDHPRSVLRVVSGIGTGTTMFSAWQYLKPRERTLEQWLATWAAWALEEE